MAASGAPAAGCAVAAGVALAAADSDAGLREQAPPASSTTTTQAIDANFITTNPREGRPTGHPEQTRFDRAILGTVPQARPFVLYFPSIGRNRNE
jgi:hypothetical protein